MHVLLSPEKPLPWSDRSNISMNLNDYGIWTSLLTAQSVCRLRPKMFIACHNERAQEYAPHQNSLGVCRAALGLDWKLPSDSFVFHLGIIPVWRCCLLDGPGLCWEKEWLDRLLS